MTKTTQKTQTVSQRITSYLGSRKTPATKLQICKAMPKVKEGTVQRMISYMLQDGNVQAVALSKPITNTRGRPISTGYMLIQSN